MRIWATSDLHGHLPEPPSQADALDLAVIAGDVCQDFGIGSDLRSVKQLAWWNRFCFPWLLQFPRDLPVIVIWGNHDFLGEQEELGDDIETPPNVFILTDKLIEVNGKRIFGSPWSLSPLGWAFAFSDDKNYREHLMHSLPTDLDILVTHGPPSGPAGLGNINHQFGSEYLDTIVSNERIPLVICGHIHEAFGLYYPNASRPYTVANVSRCNLLNQPVNQPVILEV